MITSTTELLNELAEVSSQSPGVKWLPNKSQAPEASQKLRKEFAMRYRCMQSWYLRCSWKEKIKWLTQMLQGLKSIESLSVILTTLKGVCSKSTVYAGCQYTTDFVYDKALQDHNRTIHKKALMETQESDIKWFKLCEDSEQILMLIGMIRLGGGSIMQHIYERGIKLYQQKAEELKNLPKPYDGVVEIKAETPRTHMSDYNIQAGQQRTSNQNLMPALTRAVSIKPDDVNEFEVYDSTDPYVIEVENHRKAWNDMITKYQVQVEGKSPKAAKEKGKKGGTSKSSKSSKSGKSSKSNKTSKSGKKKKGKKGEDEELDQIQLLPIWLVKKIFNYLDAKTLKKAKSVNKYWAYAITDLQKEQKARKALDKFIRKMEASVASSQIQLDAKPKMLREQYDTSTSKKRVLKLSERGATLPKLKGKFKKPIIEKCLATDAVKEMPERYILPVLQVAAFPRSVARATPLYKVPSCITNELGFTKIYFEEDTDEDVEKTYTTVTLIETTPRSDQDGNRLNTTESESKPIS